MSLFHRGSLWLGFFLITGGVLAADLRLSVLSIDANRRPTLRMTGLDSGDYRLEASTNLVQWFQLTTGPGTNGELLFTHTDASRFGTLFYRGLRLSPPAAPIVPQVDSNQIAMGVITYAEGGRLALTNTDGTRYTFTIAPSNVISSVAITMQIVTNFSAFPYENERRTGVEFQPSGLQFHGAGLLEIEYPNPIPHLSYSSFAFNGAGGDFHLVPDRVSTNAVRIPVTHFSVFGTAVWGPTERTRAFTARTESVQAGYEHRIAEVLGRSRQQQLLGAGGDDASAMAEVFKAAQDLYDRQLAPEIAAAEGDCSLFLALTPRILGMERQFQLLGGGDAPSFLSTASTGKSICNCLNELIFACEEASISSESFMRGLLGIERQSALLGTSSLENCGLGTVGEWVNDALNKKLPCMTAWIGTVSYSESGTFYDQRTSTSTVGGTQPTTVQTTITESLSVQYSFEGGVERVELEDDSIPGFFTSLTWDLYFFPDAQGTYTSTSRTTKDYVCRGEFGVQQEDSKLSTRASGPGSNQVRIHFVFEDGQLTAFTLLEQKALSVKGTSSILATRTDCPRKDPNTGQPIPSSPITTLNTQGASTHTFNSNYVPTEQVVFTKRTATELEGTVKGNRQELFAQKLVSVPYTWKFSLRRRPE